MADTFFSSAKRYPLTLKPITPPAVKETHQDIFNILNSIKSILRDLDLTLATFVTEAPEDGNQYARQDGAWSIVTGGGGGAAVWGSITGLLSDQTDLNTALSGKESTLAAGTTAQYYRGDKTWQTLNWAAVSGKPTFAAVATSGSYLDLSNTPIIPAAQVNSDWNATSGVAQILNKPSVRVQLTAARTYYVRTDGNDSNTGLTNTAGGAFATVQKAIDTVASLDISTYDVTIRCTGNFTQSTTFKSIVGAGKVIIRGDADNVTTMTVAVTGANINAFDIGPGFQGTYSLQYMSISSAGASGVSTGGSGLANIEIGNVSFGACNFYHVWAATTQCINFTAPCTITGGALAFIRCSDSATVRMNQAFTLTGTPAFVSGFAVAERGAGIVATIATFTGTATGKRYQVSLNAYIFVNGAGETFLPGNAAGTIATGGQYA